MTKLPFKYGIAAVGLSAVAGALINKEDREKGAAIGLGAGLAAAAGIRGYANWSSSKVLRPMWNHTPFKASVATAAITAGALGVGAALSPTLNETESKANSDGIGGYNPEILKRNYQYSLSDRIASMNVSGDLVFGLHNKRHG